VNEEWHPRSELTEHEAAVLKLCKKQKLWGFLRQFREVILDAEIGRSIAALLEVAAVESERDAVALAEELEITVAFGSSVKAVLDVDWREAGARAEALRELLAQFDRVRAWLHTQFDRTELSRPPLSEHLATVERIIAQDTDPDPDRRPKRRPRVATPFGRASRRTAWSACPIAPCGTAASRSSGS